MGTRTWGLLVVVAAGLGAAGCSSSSTSTATTASTGATTTSTAATATTPGGTAGGAATPQDVAGVYLAALHSKDFTAFCALAVPSQQAACTKDIGSVVGEVTFSDMAIGSIHTVGDQALLVVTGSICETIPSSEASQTTQAPQCQSNHDTGLPSGETFAKAFANADDPESTSGSAFVSALVQQGGRWYASGF